MFSRFMYVVVAISFSEGTWSALLIFSPCVRGEYEWHFRCG